MLSRLLRRNRVIGRKGTQIRIRRFHFPTVLTALTNKRMSVIKYELKDANDKEIVEVKNEIRSRKFFKRLLFYGWTVSMPINTIGILIGLSNNDPCVSMI